MIKKWLLIASNTILIGGSLTPILRNHRSLVNNQIKDPTPPYYNSVSARHYQFNDPKSLTPEYGVSFNFNIAFYSYNYFCLAMENIEEHKIPQNINFWDFFLGQYSYDSPSNWRNVVQQYNTLLKQTEDQYHTNSIGEDLRNWLSSDPNFLFNIFLGKSTTNSLDPKQYSYEDLEKLLRQRGAIFQIALDNIGGKWKIDDINTRMMVRSKANDILSYYYYNPKGSVFGFNYNAPTIYLKIPNWDPKKKYTIEYELNYIFPAVQKYFNFPLEYEGFYSVAEKYYNKTIHLEGSKFLCSIGLEFFTTNYTIASKPIRSLPINIVQSNLV